nr:NS3 [Guangxi orbivirus]
MHAAISSAKRENDPTSLVVVPATAPRLEEVGEVPLLDKRVRFALPDVNVSTAKSVALDVLANALGGGTGTDEITRQERSAYGAAAQALNEDANTKVLRVYMNAQIMPRLKGKLRTANVKYRFWLALEITLALISTVIFSIMAVTEAEKTVNSTIERVTGLKVGLSAFSLICTGALLFVSRHAGSLNEFRRRLRREVVKRETYNFVANNHEIGRLQIGTETRGDAGQSRMNVVGNPAWISAPGNAAHAEGWQLSFV